MRILIAGAIIAVTMTGCSWLNSDDGFLTKSEETAVKAAIFQKITSDMTYKE